MTRMKNIDLELIYFPFPFWRAEISRIALHLGGISFRDRRVSGEEFQTLRAQGTLPMQQVPILIADGKVLTQSASISRFCAHLAGIYPKDLWEAAKVDELLDIACELTYKFAPAVPVKDPEKRLQFRAKIAEVDIPKAFSFIEKQLESSGTGYYVCDSLTLADLAVWRLTNWLTSGLLDGIPTTVADPYPLLKAHHDRIASDPRILEWTDKHKK